MKNWTSAMLIVLTASLLMLSLIPVTSATVTELNVTPSVVLQGEEVSITGEALPNEDVWLHSSFEIELPVSDGEYLREFKDIYIPGGEKKISVTAENIKNIRISVYPVFWRTVEYPLEEPLNATNGTATITLSFPVTYHGITIDIQGKKDIKVYGDATEDATSVNLRIKTSIKTTADSDGDFSLNISTKGVPAGEFLINVDGVKKKVRVKSPIEKAVFEITDLTLMPESVESGEKARISATVTNVGNITGSTTVNITIGEELLYSEPVTLDPNESKTITHTYTGEEAGTFTVAIDGMRKTLTVMGETPGYPAICTILSILLVTLCYALRKE